MLLRFKRPRIALIELSGLLGGTRSRWQLQQLSRLKESRRCRAVVLDVDSPGGSASVSEYFYFEVAKLAAVKPVVAFIRGLGTSGAYLACCPAHKIISLPSALIGSIGVISLHPILPELLEKLGIRFAVTKGGKFKDMGAFYREPTPEEREKELELVNEFYVDFVAKVARARKLDQAKIEKCATGEVFSAYKALELGLIDEIGDLDKAIDIASELAKVPRRYFFVRPPRPLLERLLSPLASSIINTAMEEIESRFNFPIYYK